MVPARETFWNVQFGEIIYLLAAIAVGIFLYAIYLRYRVWRRGRPANRANQWSKRIRDFIVLAVVDGLLHRKFFGADDSLGSRFNSPREFYPGLTHVLIFMSAVIFFLATFLEFISHYFFGFLRGGVYLGYSVVVDSFGMLAIIGVILALIRRYGVKPARLESRGEDLAALLLILILVVSGFTVEGMRIATTELKLNPDWAPWSPGGYVLALAFSGLSDGTLLAWHTGVWWFHVILSLGTISYVSLSYTNLFHIIWAPVNVFLKNLAPHGALVPVDFEKADTFGAAKIEDFTWKQLLDLDACTRCGRCQDACPAYFSGKALNPKKVIQDLKTHLNQVYPACPLRKPIESRPDMISAVITEPVIWDCTTCRACQQVCPVYIEHVDKIVDMRRNLVMERSQFPESAQEALKSLGARGHPFRGATASRTDWATGLGVKALSEASNIDVLYWVGCTAALEDRNVKVSVATTKLLQTAGINFGVLGAEESCCGDPARRMGDEYLFQTICQANIELLNSYNVKKIVTTCAHCFNSLKNEYPQFGGNFEVIHHTQFLADLIRDGRLKLSRTGGDRVVAFHDSCYLGRYNGIYQPPRDILQAINGINRVELARYGSRGFCCGGGGGHMWLEEDPDKRVNARRVEDVIQAKVNLVTTACPYCLTMFEDGLKSKAVEESIKAMDLSELLLQVL